MTTVSRRTIKIYIGAAFILIWIGISSLVRADSLDDASTAIQNDNFSSALRIVQPLADAGNARAQYILGIMYARGDGVTQSYEDASRLMKKSAEQGFQKAQLTIARMYRLGQGVPRDAGRSQYWLAKAGTGSAQKNLASRVTEARSKSEPEKTSPSPHTVRVQPNSATPPASVDGFAGIKFGESIDDTIKKLNTRCETQVPHDAFHPQLRDDVIVCLPGLRIFGEQTEVAIHFAGAARAVDLISFTLRSKAAQREALKVIRTKYGDAVDSENLDGPLIDYYAGHQINVTAVNDGLAINYNAKSLANLLSREIADRREKVRQRTRENQSDVNGSAF